MSILRRPPRVEYLIVGLGNPGPAYARTRHNVGFRCLRVLARRSRLSLRRKKARARIAVGTIAGRPVVLARPYTYMNRSGGAVAGLRRWLGLPPGRILVLYDDLDLPLGTIRLRGKGGTAGHKGMRSITEALGTQDFPRLRLGIGRPADASGDPIDYVLGDLSRQEEGILVPTLERAADAVECLLREGLEVAMNHYNRPPPDLPAAGRRPDD
jgi:PTH1 family peptidyl-tRNA hydrolase